MLSTLFNKENKEVEIFYLRGFQRSGTNWVSNILNLHPDINCKGEYHLEHLFAGYNKIQTSKFNALKNDEHFTQRYFNFIDEIILEKCKYARFSGERTPTSLVSTYTPGRKNIMISRDGRDCVISWVYHSLRRGIISTPNMMKRKEIFDIESDFFEGQKELLLADMPNYIKRLGRMWHERIQSDLEQISLADEKEIEMPYYHIQYEDLIQNTEKVRNEVYAFIGADPTKAKSLDDNTKPGFENHDPNHHNRIGKAGRWREYFTERQHDIFLSVAQKSLEDLGLSTTY